jgi:hypothetical protein
LAWTAAGAFFYVTTIVFALLGFGLLFAAIARSTLSGFFVSFFVVGLTTIFSPVLQKFWADVFHFSFSQNEQVRVIGTDSSRDYLHYLSGDTVLISFYAMRVSLLNAISQLVTFYAIYQKVHVGQIFILSVIFQIFWNLNFALNILVARNQPESLDRFFDDYLINQVFLFGSVFGLVVALINKKPPREDLAMGIALPRRGLVANNEVGLVLSLVGTFLLFITFMGITIAYPVKATRTRFLWGEGYMNILFALSASVFTIIFLSSLTKNQLGFRELNFGMFGGAILGGSVAGTLDNIGAFMAIGTVAGVISVLYFQYLHPRLNRTSVFDTYGATYLAIISFLATFFIAPLVITGMFNGMVYSNLLMNVLVVMKSSAGWILSYVGISTGVALGGGLFAGLIIRIFQN